MRERYNPLSLGMITETVGTIPEGPNNPEIVYTPGGEKVAAVAYLTFLLMDQRIVDHVKATGYPIVCSHSLDDRSERVVQNLYEKEAVTKLRPEIQADKDRHRHTLGLNTASSIISVFYETPRKLSDRMVDFMMHVMNEPEEDTGETAAPPETEDLSGTADALFRSLPPSDAGLLIHKVYEIQDDPEAMRDLMRKICTVPAGGAMFPETGLHTIPQVLCHEIGHLGVVSQATRGQGAKDDFLLFAGGFAEPDPSGDDGGHRMPGFENFVFMHNVIEPERLAAQGVPENWRFKHYLNDRMEAEAQLIGEQIVRDMNERHSLNIYTHGLGKVMPKSDELFSRWVSNIEPPSPISHDFVDEMDLVENLHPST